jgi:hypothetical protein
MKKAATWYLFALAVLNLLFAYATPIVSNIWKTEFRERVIPVWSQYTLAFSWWPWFFLGIAILLLLISIFSKSPSKPFYHFIACILFLECLILFTSQMGLALPLVKMWSNVPDLEYPPASWSSYEHTKTAPETTNFICLRPCGNLQTKPFPILMIVETNTAITTAVRIAGLWDEPWPAKRIYLSPGDLQETIAQMKPVALRCAGITNSGYYDMAITIDDSGSIFTNTIAQTDMCRLLQTIPQHILQENKLFNRDIGVEKTIEDCEPSASIAR